MNRLVNNNLDQSDMKKSISNFPLHIQKSFEIMKVWNCYNKYENISSVLILGMGGSAIGGDVAKVISQDSCKVPIIINRSYEIPTWVNATTLVLASSYSGNTEETLTAFEKCHCLNCPIIILSTGGKILEYALKYNLDSIVMESGLQPRAALGFSFSLILLLLNRLNIIDNSVINLLENSIEPLIDLCSELDSPNNLALKQAKNIQSTCPIIYGSAELTWVVALRFRGQLAENAKILSFHHILPEQNHNEIEGWTLNKKIMQNMSIVWLEDQDDHHGTKKRMELSKSLLRSYPKSHLTFSIEGPNRCERLLKLIHFTDWVSYYLALINNIDPTPVKRIKKLKDMLSNE